MHYLIKGSYSQGFQVQSNDDQNIYVFQSITVLFHNFDQLGGWWEIFGPWYFRSKLLLVQFKDLRNSFCDLRNSFRLKYLIFAY